MTYRQLERRSAAIAHRICAIAPGGIVAICVDRDIDLIPVLIGVLKAGCSFVPIDSELPPDRILYILQDAKPDLLVVKKLYTDRFERAELARLHPEDIADYTFTLPEADNATTRSDIAYIIYTSGSTGRPKGVRVYHTSVINALQYIAEQVGISTSDRLLALTSVAFDISVLEMFLPLMFGAAVVVGTRADAKDPDAIMALIHTRRITALQATPTGYGLLRKHWPRLAPMLLLCGGEPVTHDLVEALDNGRLWNLYGPTETTIWSTMGKLKRGQAIDAGRPIANTLLLIVNDQGEVVPEGLVGELCIGGDGVAAGYVNQPRLTNDRFLSSDIPGSPVIYRTGDDARFDAAGNVVIIGRRDSQVKIRGFRIELEEIEAVVRQRAPVKDCIAVAARAADEQFEIWLFFTVGEHQLDFDKSHLSYCLTAALPSYMIPSRFERIDAVPLTVGGKADRAKLAELASSIVASQLPDGSPHPSVRTAWPDNANAKPRRSTEIEQRSALFCQKALGLQSISLDDDLIALGIDSLRIVQLSGMLASEFGRIIPISSFYQHPTLRAILAESESRGLSGQTTITATRRSEYPLSPQQRRWWNVYLPFHDDNCATMVGRVTLDHAFSKTAWETSINVILDGEISLRAEFRRTPIAVSQKPNRGTVALNSFMTVADEDLASRAAETMTRLAGVVLKTNEWPLFRLEALSGSNKSNLLYCVHHLVFDGMSQHIFGQKLKAIARQVHDGEILRTSTSRSVNFFDYALWESEQEASDSEKYLQAEAYWKGVYSKNYAPKRLLPAESGHPSAEGAAYTFALRLELLRMAETFCRREGVTFFSLILATKFITFSLKTRCADMVFGTPALGREDAATKDMIGNFISLVTVRVSLNRDASLPTFVKALMLQLADAMQHQSYQYDRLVQHLGLPFEQDAFPLTGIFMSFINFEGDEMLGLQNESLGHRDLGGNVKFEMMSYLKHYTDGYTIDIRYRKSLFPLGQVTEFAEDWMTVLENVLGGNGLTNLPHEVFRRLPCVYGAV